VLSEGEHGSGAEASRARSSGAATQASRGPPALPDTRPQRSGTHSTPLAELRAVFGPLSQGPAPQRRELFAACVIPAMHASLRAAETA